MPLPYPPQTGQPPPAGVAPPRAARTPGRGHRLESGPVRAEPQRGSAAASPVLDRRRWTLALLIYLVVVIYGSLVPFDLRPMTLDAAITRFTAIPFLDLGPASRADWIANIVLYVPLAFLACVAILGLRTPRLGSYLGAALIFTACVALAVGVEFTQVFFAPRTVSLNDLLAEVIGSGLGVLLWGLARERIVQLARAFAAGGRDSVVAAAVVFAIGYVLLSLFPYDFVVSGAELADRLGTVSGRWLLGNCNETFRCLALAAAEVLSIAPLGLLLTLLSPRLGLGRLFLLGIIAGVALELLQLLLLSGSSRLLSVLLRGLGLVAGGLLGRLLLTRLGIGPLAVLIGRALPLLALPYLLALAALSGWLSGAWLSPARALARLGELGWVPFYYHYWTSETMAMASLLAQLGLYAPVGVAFWARALAWPGRSASAFAPAATAVVLAVIIEIGKLFAPGARPDPTNIIIAPMGAWLAYAVAIWFTRVLKQATAAPAMRPVKEDSAPPGSRPAARGGRVDQPAAEAPTGASRHAPRDRFAARGTIRPAGAETGRASALFGPGRTVLPRPTLPGYGYALIFGGAAVAGLVLYPVAQLWLAVALLLFAAALWRWPWLWLVAVPPILPLLDLTPWSGRVVLSAFDLFVLAGLAVVGLRLSGVRPVRIKSVWLALALLLLWLSWLVATGIGLAPFAGADGPVASSHPVLAAWHEGKGLLWALLAVPLLRRFRRLLGSRVAAPLLLTGAVTGLALVCVAVLDERLAHVGLFDLAGEFRVTGPFASMHDGGAYIEAYLAFAFPMLLVWALISRLPWQRAAGAVLVPIVGYTMLVTFSRAGYGALAVGAAVAVGGLLAGGAARRLPARRWLVPAALLALLAVAAVPALTTGFASERLARIGADIQSRLEHWRHAIGLMDGGIGSIAFGEGFGRYPALYLFAPRHRLPAGTFQVLEEDGNDFLRLGAGEAVYLDQRVSVRAGTNYRLSLRLRGSDESAQLSVPLCEKALLYSFTCVWTKTSPDAPGQWQEKTLLIQSGDVGRGGPWPRGPVKLSLYNSGSGVIDVDDISLRPAGGGELIANGGFESGAERWLLATDQDLAWHIHEQFLETYFAQGVLGLLALAALLVAVVSVLVPAMRAGRPEAAAFAGALTGFLAVGLLGSTVDAPRTAMMFYLGALCAAVLVRGGESRRGQRRPRGGD